MPFVPPFSPLAVGAVDSFAFDLTQGAGRATVTPGAVTWTCVFGGPGGTSDGAAQSRIISTEIKTSIPSEDDDGDQITLYGVFAAALIGTFPPSSAGGNYVITVTAPLSDGRILVDSGAIASFAPSPYPPTDLRIVFDYDTWVGRYPEFSPIDPGLAQAYFNEATLYHRNDATGPVRDPINQQTLLFMVTAHIAELYRVEGDRAVNPLVGRIGSATQGSVTLSTELDMPAGTPQWWSQTKYGLSYWSATAVYRTMHYRSVPMRIFDPFYGGRFIGGFGGY